MIIWLKATTIGFLASLCVMLVMLLLIRLDLAPYSVPPPLALAAALRLQPWPMQGVILHYAFGIFWALVFLALFRRRLTLRNGLLLGLLMWGVFMLILAPLMGWGMFVTRAADYARLPDDPLYLRSMPGFLGISLLFSLMQGALVGWLSRRWIGLEARRNGRTQRRQSLSVR